MANRDADLDLLLSLREERVLETPPASPSSNPAQLPAGYNSDDDYPRRSRTADMSVFRDVVKDYLDMNPETLGTGPPKAIQPRTSSDEIVVDKFSGLRIRESLVDSIALANHFSDVRFVRLHTIRNLIMGDKLSGCWATVGVLTEPGSPKVSSTGKNYCIWKMGCLNETDVSVFLFGDAYTVSCKEKVGMVFALFNASVRRGAGAKEFYLSVYSASQMLKIGTSADYGICKGKRKDGVACTMIIDKRKGTYCKFHSSKASQLYATNRTELRGGNIQNAFKLQSEGIYTVDPFAVKSSLRKPVKVMSIDGLKRALSKADKVTTSSHSQGIRFLTQVTAKQEPKNSSKAASVCQNSNKYSTEKRSSLTKGKISTTTQNEPQAKKKKVDHAAQNMIELDIISSDEEL
ncbi:protein MCM10 homolog isoform X1 [Zingiber officinale]|uniref:protein MCM10 homolog isoform X1 n=1 Tax=Zingiber officinale TaxID=94328 RepID=UPI001C4B2D9D|nr:protein MCM10 homolog isoform X1 [Zingiber officinale]